MVSNADILNNWGEKCLARKKRMSNLLKIAKRHEALFVSSINGIGKQRALEILFNIVFPFFLVLFEEEGQRQYIDFIYGLYEPHPALGDNSKTRAMKAELLENPPSPPFTKGGLGGLKINSVKTVQPTQEVEAIEEQPNLELVSYIGIME